MLAPTQTPRFSMNGKIILKDLPFNEVSNEHMLKVVKEWCDMKSEVWYSNIWIDGKKTYLHNGDRFFYIADEDVVYFEKALHVGGFKARVMKPATHNRCSQCNLVGHQPSSEMCITKAPAKIQQTIVFRGKDNPLSNMFVYPEGCS